MKQIFQCVISVSLLLGCSLSLAPEEITGSEESEKKSANLETTFSGECNDAMNQRFIAVISSQIEDLRELNFETAYRWAAPEFRDSNSLEVFTTVIKSNYSSLLNSRSAFFANCIVYEDLWGSTRVTVQTYDGELKTYTYRMILATEEGWRVFGVSREPELRSLS